MGGNFHNRLKKFLKILSMQCAFVMEVSYFLHWNNYFAYLNLLIFNNPKRIQLHTVYSEFLEQIKPLQLVGLEAELTSEFERKPFPAKGCSRFQQTIEGFENFWLQNQLPSTFCSALTQLWLGISKEEAVAASTNQLALGKSASTMLPLSLLLRVKIVLIGQWWLNFFPQETDFRWMLPELITELIALLNLVSFIGLWAKKWHKNKSPCCKSNPVQLSEKRASAQIPIKLHSHFTWPSAKAWKQSLAWFWINYSQFLQPVMFESNVKSWIDWTSFGFLFKDFLSNLLLNTIIYWVIDQPF